MGLNEMMGIGRNENGLHLLVIEEDTATRSACIEIAMQLGLFAEGLPQADDIDQVLDRHSADVLLIETRGDRTLQLLERINVVSPDTSVIFTTATASVQPAVEAMRGGAADFLAKPFSIAQLETALQHVIEQRRTNGTDKMCSSEMEKLNRIVAKVAQSRHPVLIVGECGTGKETVARSIHAQGEFASQPFVVVECGVLSPEQIEVALFGDLEGVALKGSQNTWGALVAAQEGVVFLDEVGQLSPDLQGKLLKVLQEKEIHTARGGQSVPLRARLLAASSADLVTAVEKGTFRKDLYYRLNVVALRIPPLRERLSDIPLLAAHFLNRMSRERGLNYQLTDNALSSMMKYDWPGNVRELENTIERACAMTESTGIQLGDLPTQIQSHELGLRRGASNSTQTTELAMRPTMPPQIMPLVELEKQAILGTIKHLNGDKLLAAQLLGIGKTTLYRKLKEYEVPERNEVCS